jgi:hypothetical protein
MYSKLRAPRTNRLKLKYDNLLSSFAFKFDLHHRSLKPSKCVFYVFITSVYAHAFNSIDFPVTSH